MVDRAQTPPWSTAGNIPRRWAIGLVRPLILVILGYTILYPMIWALIGSFQTDVGDWTLANYQRALTPYYFEVLGTTIAYAAATVALSLAIAIPVAWAVARTDLPAKAAIRACIVVSFVMPPLFHALAFVFLFQPRAGLVNNVLSSLIGIRAFNIYSFAGLVIVTSLGLFPQAFLLIDAALRSIDPSLEEAASAAGATRGQIARRVTLPLVLPSILSSAVIGMIEVIAVFGPPAVIGVPAKIYVMSTQIFVELSGSPPRIEFCAALAVEFLTISTVLFTLQHRLLRDRRFTTITGKGFRPRQISLGLWRWPIFLACLFVLLVALVAPAVVLVVISLSRVWTAGLVASNLTLDFYRAALLGQERTVQGIVNTLILAVTTLSATLLIGLPIAWFAQRRRDLLSRLLQWLAFLPFSVPAIVFTVGIILAFIRPPLVLYGTLGIVAVCYFGRFLPFAVQPLSDALRQIDVSLIEAARVAGGSAVRVGTDITLPLLKYSVLSTAMLVFIACVREIVSIALLYAPGSETVMMTAMLLWDEGQVQTTAAVVTLVVVIVAAFYALAQRVALRRGIRL